MKRPLIVGLGEILWDVFPDRACFGGAPANFACSASQLGRGLVDVSMVGAVGDDEWGTRALSELTSRGVSIDHVQRLHFPTGQVLVTLDSRGHARYEFLSDTAWDNIAESSRLQEFAATLDVVCFGSLAQRSPVSQSTVRQFISCVPADSLKLFDVNLRSPYWDFSVIESSFAIANAAKLNDDELKILGKHFSLVGDEREMLLQLLNRYSLRFIALTRGERGSLLLDQSGDCSEHVGAPVQVVDTVGAGDAFTAAIAIGTQIGLTLDRMNHWANDVAAFVCTQAGATPMFPKALVESSSRS